MGSISQVARLWHSLRNVIRKWMRRFEQRGKEGLKDESRKPHSLLHKVSDDMEQKVLEARKKTGYGRKRLAWHLAHKEGIILSPNTIRHILNRPRYQWTLLYGFSNAVA